MTKILVTAKVNPDLDGTACTLAYADLLTRTGREAEGFIFDAPQSEVKYFIQKQGIQIPVKEDKEFSEWNEFVFVDASSMKGMPKMVIPEKVIEIIDHRSGEPEKEFPNAKIQNELIGAAATIVVERFIRTGLKPKPEHAKLLYGAIFHNSLNFISSNVTQRDRDAVNYLERDFNLSQNLVHEMFDFSTREVLENVAQALEMDKKDVVNGNNVIGAYQLVVWGNKVLEQKQKIKETINKLAEKSNVAWSFLNLVDLENKKSYIFSTSAEGKEILTKAIGSKFDGEWSVLDKAWLRKQIMPLVASQGQLN